MLLFSPLLQYWKRFSFCVVLFFALSVFGLLQFSPSFVSRGSLYLEGGGSRGAGAAEHALGSMMPGLAGDADLESQKEILQSNHLAMKVIARQGINTRVSGPEAYLTPSLTYLQWRLDPDPTRFDAGLKVRGSTTSDSLYQELHYTARFVDAESFEVFHRGESIATARLGEPGVTDDASFELHYNQGPPLTGGLAFHIAIVPTQGMLEGFREQLKVQGGGRPPVTNKVITVSYTSASPGESAAVVSALLDEFVRVRHDWATSGTKKTLEFVTEQIDTLRTDLDQASQRLATFSRESGGLIDVDTALQAELDKLVQTEAELSRKRLQLVQLEKLTQSLDQGDENLYLMPFEQEPLRGMVQRLGEMNVRIAQLRGRFQDDYQPLAELMLARRSLLETMRESVKNLLEQTRGEVAELEKKLEDYQAQMTQLPDQARALTEYLRATKVYEELFVFLFQEQQRNRIAVESTLTNLRQYDQPMVPLRPESPRLKTIAVLSMGLSLVLSGVVVLVPFLRIRWFTSVDEVRGQFDQPVFAVVPHRGREAKRASAGILEAGSHSPFLEAVRVLRTNLLQTMAGREHQSVLVTSAAPGDGKTSIAANLAVTLSRSKRAPRTLLIDADMHHPALHGVFGVKQSPGLSDYLNGDVSLDEVVYTIEFGDGARLDLIPAGPVPLTPTDLIEAQRMRDLLAWAREHYTFAILDGPPYPLVATASILARQTDRLLSVCRVGRTPRNLYRHHVDELSRVSQHMGLVLNVGERVGGGYGYGYGYGQTADTKRDAARTPQAAPRIIPPGSGAGRGNTPRPAPPAAESANGNGAGTSHTPPHDSAAARPRPHAIDAQTTSDSPDAAATPNATREQTTKV